MDLSFLYHYCFANTCDSFGLPVSENTDIADVTYSYDVHSIWKILTFCSVILYILYTIWVEIEGIYFGNPYMLTVNFIIPHKID